MVDSELLYANCLDLNDKEVENYWLQKMPYSRLEKVRRLKDEGEKKRSLAAGALFVLALEQAGIPGDNLVVTGSQGKPYLADYPEFYFNLTHAGDYAAMVTARVPCGIDIERTKRVSTKVIRRFFSAEEQEIFDHMVYSNEQDSATRLWTMKEAGVKMTGEGLTGEKKGPVIARKKEQYVLLENGKTIGYFTEYDEISGMQLAVCMKEERFPMEARKINLRSCT